QPRTTLTLSSTTKHPAHNRNGIGSNPGGPTIVLERQIGLKRGWPEMDGGGSAPQSTGSTQGQGTALQSVVPKLIEGCGCGPQSIVIIPTTETPWTHSCRRS